MDGIVVVSGGGTGIGRAIGAAFADAGRRVVIIGRRSDVLRSAGAQIGGGRVINLSSIAAFRPARAAWDHGERRRAEDVAGAVVYLACRRPRT